MIDLWKCLSLDLPLLFPCPINYKQSRYGHYYYYTNDYLTML